MKFQSMSGAVPQNCINKAPYSIVLMRAQWYMEREKVQEQLSLLDSFSHLDTSVLRDFKNVHTRFLNDKVNYLKVFHTNYGISPQLFPLIG